MSLRIVRRSPREAAATWEWPDHIHPILRQVYARRALDGIEDLDLNLAGIAPVGSFDVLESAAELLIAHRASRIIVVGDYDSDGATSTALMLLCLRALGFEDVQYFIPDRRPALYSIWLK